MARYSISFASISPTATADTTNLVDSTYAMAVNGGNGTMELKYNEVYIGGEGASSAAPTIWVFGRDSQVGTGTIGAGTLRSALLDASATAPGTIMTFGQTFATNKPQRSSTLGHLLALSMNAYGGITRWVARQGEEVKSVGNTASLGEMSLSAFTGGTPGACSGHVVFELV
jgi:hypothetical protein